MLGPRREKPEAPPNVVPIAMRNASIEPTSTPHKKTRPVHPMQYERSQGPVSITTMPPVMCINIQARMAPWPRRGSGR